MIDRKKILILDPSSLFRRTLKEVIQKSASHVDIIEADRSGKAEEVLKNSVPHVVFIDIALNRNNGLKFIESIKGKFPDMLIVVLTNHDSAEHEKAALQKGADYFLSKEHSGGLRLLDVIQKSIHRKGIN